MVWSQRFYLIVHSPRAKIPDPHDSILRPFGPEDKYTPNDPGLHLVEVVPQRPLKIKCIVLLVVEDTMVRAASPDERTEVVIARDALAEHVGAGQHAVGRHALLEQSEDAALFRHRDRHAVQEVVHADRVELVFQGQRGQDVRDHGIGVGLLGAKFGDGEGARFVVDQGEARRRGDAGRVEVVACANADVEMVGAHVGTEKWQEVGGGRTAPGVGVDEAEDPKVVDSEAPRGIKFLGLIIDDFGDGRSITGFGAAKNAVGERGRGDGGNGSGCHV